jgi:hypothetical protein
MEPGVEAIRIAQARQVAPGTQIGLRDRVSGEFRVPEDQAGDRFEPGDRVADERGEGVVIALARPLDISPLVHGTPRDAPTRSLQGYRRRVTANHSLG